jgi:hypothetical protein
VTVNPELKLLQYNVGQPLQLEESNGYMLEKEGTIFVCNLVTSNKSESDTK